MLIDLNNVVLPTKKVRALGIDLGTTNSAVAEAIWDPDSPDEIAINCMDVAQFTTDGEFVSPIVPSAVAILKGKTIVGEGAKRLIGNQTTGNLQQNRSIFYGCKNEIGTNMVYPHAPEGFQSPKEIAKCVLSFLQKFAEAESKIEIGRTVITVPASFQVSQREDTKEAAKSAGIDVSEHGLLDEPIAAFLYHKFINEGELDVSANGNKLLVFDFGGGTCDIAIFEINNSNSEKTTEFTPISVSRYHRLGGADIDLAIVHKSLIPQLVKENGLKSTDLSFSNKKNVIAPILIRIAESMKISLCNQILTQMSYGKYETSDKNKVSISNPGEIPIKLKEKQLKLTSPTLTAAEFEKVLEPFLDTDMKFSRVTQYLNTCSIFAPIDDALERAKLTSEEIDYVLLAGGSSQIPKIKESFDSYMPQAQKLDFSSLEKNQIAMACGAALHSLSLTLTSKGLVQPVAYDDISIKTSVGSDKIVSRGSKLPIKSAKDLRYKCPGGSDGKPVDLQVKFVAGSVDDEQTLFHDLWKLNPPVSKNEVLLLSYNFDENQTFEFKFSRLDAPRAKFEHKVENLYSNVCKPDEVFSEIQKIEYELRAKRESPEVLAPQWINLLKKYYDAEFYEKAVEVSKQLVRQNILSRPWLFSMIAGCYEKLSDFERAQKFHEQTVENTKDSGYLFNFALFYKSRHDFQSAKIQLAKAIKLSDEPPYRVLEASLESSLGNDDDCNQILKDHLPRFGGIGGLNNWELVWYRYGCELYGDKENLTKAIEAQRKRNKLIDEEESEEGLLPEPV